MFLHITSGSHTCDIHKVTYLSVWMSVSVSNHVCVFREYNRRLLKDPIYETVDDQFKIDAMMIMEFNICMVSYDDIPLEAWFSRRALLATANCVAIRRMLGVPFNSNGWLKSNSTVDRSGATYSSDLYVRLWSWVIGSGCPRSHSNTVLGGVPKHI